LKGGWGGSECIAAPRENTITTATDRESLKINEIHVPIIDNYHPVDFWLQSSKESG
jgi:hypothetical protein